MNELEERTYIFECHFCNRPLNVTYVNGDYRCTYSCECQQESYREDGYVGILGLGPKQTKRLFECQRELNRRHMKIIEMMEIVFVQRNAGKRSKS